MKNPEIEFLIFEDCESSPLIGQCSQFVLTVQMRSSSAIRWSTAYSATESFRECISADGCVAL